MFKVTRKYTRDLLGSVIRRWWFFVIPRLRLIRWDPTLTPAPN